MIARKNNVGYRLLLLAMLALLAGCTGGRYPVHGRVLYPDGSPLTEGTVVGEAAEGETRFVAQGNVKSDGTFTWGTQKPGDGAKPGKYRVVVLSRAVSEYEESQGKLPAVDPKYANPQTSGLDFEIKPGENELNITVTRSQASDDEQSQKRAAESE